MTETPTITKNLTIKSTVDNLTVKRNSDAYFAINSGCQLGINTSTSDKKIVFADAETDITSNYILGVNGKLVAYNVSFMNVSYGAVLVGSAQLHGCSFTGISSSYGAVHIMSYKSAIVDGCTFSGNTSTNAVGYGDIYLAKGSEDTNLTLSGNVSTDIRIYVANNTCSDPKIDVGGISFADGKKLRVKVDTIPDSGSDSIVMFKCSYDMKDNMTFAINNSAYTDEYELLDIIEDNASISNSTPFYSMFNGDLQEFYVYKNW